MIGLLAVVRRHREAIEADLLRWYQLDIARHLGGPSLTLRRLAALLRSLPDEAAFRRSAGVERPWTLTEHLLASVVDAVRVADHRNIQIRTKRRLAPPKPIPRPGATDEGESGASTIGAGNGMTIAELRKKLDQPRIDRQNAKEVRR
jgi:hypothetical protein